MELLDTAPLRDQRTMVGPWLHTTVEDVERGWERWAEEEGLSYRRRRRDLSTSLVGSRKTIVAYVSGGRWIADCPTCNGGVACWPGHDRGCCLDCGTIFRVDHPSEADCLRAAELLGARTRVDLRGWHRHQGETLEQLERENALLAEQAEKELRSKLTVRLDDVEQILGPSAAAKLRKGLS